jgi:hypothetical protein
VFLDVSWNLVGGGSGPLQENKNIYIYIQPSFFLNSDPRIPAVLNSTVFMVG